MTSSRTPNTAEIIRAAIDGRLADTHTMLPGRIDAFDADTQKADIAPMLKRIQKASDGDIVEDLPVIPSVPVIFPRGGDGFKITFPVVRGDRCMLIFADRSIDNYQLSGGREEPGPPARYEGSDPEAFQMHDLSDAVAILGWYPDNETVSTVNADALVLGKEKGSVIHIEDDTIHIYGGDQASPFIRISPTGIAIDGDDLTFLGNTVNLGSGSPTEFVALAQKVLDELNLIKTDLDGFKSTFDAHTHPVPSAGLLDGMGAPVTGSATSSAPGSTAPTPHTPASVASAKVRAD